MLYMEIEKSRSDIHVVTMPRLQKRYKQEGY